MSFFQTVREKAEAGAAWAKRTGSSAYRQASSAAQATQQAAARAAQQARQATEAAARAAAEKARAGAAWTRDRAVEGARWTRDRAVEGAQWTKEKAQQGVEWGKEKGRQARDAAGRSVEWTKQKAAGAARWANKKGQQITNRAVGGIASGVGSAATRNRTVEGCIEGMARDKARVNSPEDGQYMGNNCPKTSPNPPTTGRLPEGCSGHGGKLPKIIYTNGINTPPAAACATMRKIANERCAEVIGVYNATYGTKEDGLDSKNNIDRAGKEPAAHSQARLMNQMLNAKPPQKVTIYAHSQGGLITQEGLYETQTTMQQETAVRLRRQGMSAAQAKRESDRQTREKMSNVDVYSFGTAEKNWPDTGTRYHQFTNTADPVPKLISSVQANRGAQTEPVNLVERHRFEKNAWNPIAPHSMDDAYIPELSRVRPIPKKANGRCC